MSFLFESIEITLSLLKTLGIESLDQLDEETYRLIFGSERKK